MQIYINNSKYVIMFEALLLFSGEEIDAWTYEVYRSL